MVNFVQERKKFALLTLAQAPTSTNIDHRVALSMHTYHIESSRNYSSPQISIMTAAILNLFCNSIEFAKK